MTTLAYNAQTTAYYAAETVTNRICPLVCEVNDSAAKCIPNGFSSLCDATLTDSSAAKALIEKHPLFPLLTLIFQKCELATSSNQPTRLSDASSNSNEQASSGDAANMITSHSFDEDIDCFAQSLVSKSTLPNGRFLGASQLLFCGNEELDSLMVGASRVLRLHLLEIEKVHELADRFVGKYVANIRERILPEIQLDKDDASESCGSPMASNLDESEAGEKKRSRKRKAAPLPTSYVAPPSMTTVTNGIATASNEKCSTWLQRVSIPDSHGSGKAEEVAVELPSENKRHQANHFNVNLNDCSSLLKNSSGSEESYEDDDNDNDETSSGKRSTKRGVFPKMATNILRAWLFQHLNHPYPTEKQKQQLSHDTNLSVLQVNNWFINARRRIVQPMIDQSNQLNAAVH